MVPRKIHPSKVKRRRLVNPKRKLPNQMWSKYLQNQMTMIKKKKRMIQKNQTMIWRK